MIGQVTNWFNKLSKPIKQKLWFIILWFTGVGAMLLLSLMVKLIMKI